VQCCELRPCDAKFQKLSTESDAKSLPIRRSPPETNTQHRRLIPVIVLSPTRSLDALRSVFE
jgi:hypothetical protein